MQRAKQYQVFREQLLTSEKTASDCDRSLFGNGGSGAVCDRPLVGMNRHRSEKPVQGGLNACPTRIVGDI
ncbi:hypothetical protein [Microcoleus sp. S13_C5]|uniref:hypothetical protein n=1 Tax=Microcoleus sp. S13_C5 TaxID=3055411 RepID=UPI002FD1A72F